MEVSHAASRFVSARWALRAAEPVRWPNVPQLQRPHPATPSTPDPTRRAPSPKGVSSPSTIHPFGASDHLRCAYRAHAPVRLASFSPMRCVAGSRAGSTVTRSAARPMPRFSSSRDPARCNSPHRPVPPQATPNVLIGSSPHQTLIASLWAHLSRDDDGAPHRRRVVDLESLLVFMIWLSGSVKLLCAFGSGSP